MSKLNVAISNFKDGKFDIYLVDDGSTDGTGVKVKSCYPNINVIQGNGDLYWGGGTNLAWETAAATFDYDFYIWFNDDGMLYEDSIITLFRALNNRADVIIGGAFHATTSLEVTYGGNEGGVFLTPNGVNCQTFSSLNGNLVLIPKEVYKKLGFIEKRFRHYRGDNDYGFRAIRQGIVLLLTDKFVGCCDRNYPVIQAWLDLKNNFFKRIKIYYSPFGPDPISQFYFTKKYDSLPAAVKEIIVNHIGVLFPSLLNVLIRCKSRFKRK